MSSLKREAFLLLDPFHALGRSFCAFVARRGELPIAVSEDPDAGSEFSVRMALEGTCVPHRTIHTSFPDAELRLAQDLGQVFGGIRGMVSFFPLPVRRENWLELPLTAANELVRESVNRRLRLLRALAPLLERRGFLQNVIMGVIDEDGSPVSRVDEATAHLWDDLLAGEWERRGVLVRRTYTRMVASDGGSFETLFEDLDRVQADFERCLQQTRLPGAA
ncbi:MAG: hypothetical protein AAGE01_12050 [Pseudomonadota bacterium]